VDVAIDTGNLKILILNHQDYIINFVKHAEIKRNNVEKITEKKYMREVKYIGKITLKKIESMEKSIRNNGIKIINKG